MTDDRITDVKFKKQKNPTLPSGIEASLVVLDGPDKGVTYKISRYETLLGRSNTDIVLSDTSVSRQHARIVFERGEFILEDLQSSNGTYINGQPIDKQALKNRDHLAIGDTVISFATAAQEQEKEEQTDPSLSLTAYESGGEKKFVTILFADISGFSGIAEQMDPEELTTMVNGCFERLIRIAYRYSGTVDKLMGDCVMVLFGAPIAHEDDPERAVRCAMDMIEAVAKFGRKIGRSLQVAIGINAGTVLAGAVGSKLKKDYTVMGNAVNIAQKLQKQAQPGEIRVAKELFQLTSKQVKYKTLDPFHVPGIGHPIAQYLLVSLKGGASLSTTSNITRKLVARQQEMGVIKKLCERAKKGRPTTCFITGDIGVGKSRLAKECYAHAVANDLKPYQIVLRPIAANVSYSLLFDLVLNMLEIEDVKDDELYDEIYTQLTKAGLSDEEIRFVFDIFPESYHFGRITELPAQTKMEGVFYSTIKLILNTLQQRPSFISIDGLQWADSLSLNLLRRLFALLQGNIFVLFTAREQFKLTWEVDEHIKLTNFDLQDTVAMIEQVAESIEISPTIKNNIFKLSGGNPLYIEEILASVVENKFNIEEAWKDQLNITSNLRHLIQARIDQLPQDAKNVLKHASVMGQDFDPELLAKVVGVKVNVPDSLNLLRQRGYLEEIADFQPRPIYCFHNNLIREVTRSSLLKEQVKKINKKTAKVMEAVLKKPDSSSLIDQSMLAAHFAAAGDFFKAVDYYTKAAEAMTGNGDNQTALGLYYRTIELIKTKFPDQTTTLVDRMIKTSQVACLSENFSSGLEILEDALAIVDKQKKGRHRQNRSAIMKEIGRIKRLQGDIEASQQILEQVVHELPKKGLDELHIEALRELGIVRYEKGDGKEALKYHLAALKKAKDAKNNVLVARCLNEIGLTYMRSGEIGKALNFFIESLENREKAGNQHAIAVVLPNIARAYHRIGETKLAVEYINRGLEIAQKIGDRRTQVIALYNWGEFLITATQYGDALEKFHVSFKIANQLGFTEVCTQSLINIGFIEILQGQLEKGYEKAQQGYKDSLRTKNTEGEVSALVAFAVFHHKRKDDKKAVDFFDQALEKATAINHQGLIDSVQVYKAMVEDEAK